VLRLGVLISGGGTTMVNLHRHIEAGALDAEIACVISSKRRVAGLERAESFGYPTATVSRKGFDSDEAFSGAIDDVLLEHRVDLVILAGFLRKYLPGPSFRGHTLNIHPALVPAFSGKGFYGMRVHEAVWRKGCRVSGCTVHLVDDEYDTGPILVQKAVELESGDTPEDIRRKVFARECEAYPEAIRLFIEDRVWLENGRAVIREV